MTAKFWEVFLLNLVVIQVIMVGLWTYSRRIGDPSFIDAFWSIGFVIIAVVTFIAQDGDRTRKWLILALTGTWGLRLGGYLLWRWRQNGADPRYQEMLKHAKGSKNAFMLRRVFIKQGNVMLIVSLPLQLGMLYAAPHGWTTQAMIGTALAGFGILHESIADAQLVRFRANPAKKGTVLDTGLWRFSRHPNYFGEACTWWGIYLVSVVNLPTFFGFLGPLLINIFLLTRSGIGPLESQLRKTKPGYAEYVARTSSFIPMPPKKSRTKV